MGIGKKKEGKKKGREGTLYRVETYSLGFPGKGVRIGKERK